MLQERRITIGELDANLAVGPKNGPPLLLLHGVTRAWQDWSPMLADLCARWHVHALDHRGHGGTDWTPGRYLVVDYVADVTKLLRDHFTSPVVIVGHSLGAMTAAAVAAELPDRVRAIVLEDPPFDTMGTRIGESPLQDYFREVRRMIVARPNVANLTRQLAQIPLAESGGAVTHRLGDMRDTTALRFGAAGLLRIDPTVLDPIVNAGWLDGFDATAVLAKVRCPALLLQADVMAGGMLVDADAEAAERLMAECYRIQFGGVGHLIHWTHTEAVLRLVTGFLESLQIEDAGRKDLSPGDMPTSAWACRPT